MPGDPKKRRLFHLLRRSKSTADAATGATGAEVWAAHGRALGGVRDAALAIQKMTSILAQGRGAVDAAADRARSLNARALDLGASFTRVTDAFERLGLVALNAGLEGARLGDQAGHALSLVAEEVRAHAARGAESARELSGALGEIGGDLGQVGAHVDRAREASSELGQEVARTGSAVADAERALGEISERMKQATGTDPETAKAMSEAEQHARALVGSLATLSGKVPRSLLVRALRPALEPLLRLLDPDSADEEEP